MGQITQPSSPGITVLPVDRQTGPSAGPGNTGNYVVFFGGNAGANNVGNQVIGIGNGSAGAAGTGNTTPAVIAVGYEAGKNLVGPRFAGQTDVIIGSQADGAKYSGDNVVIGNYAAQYMPGNGVNGDFYDCVVIGNYALNTFGNGPNVNSACLYSNVIGFGIGGTAVTGNATIFACNIIGYQALSSLTINGGAAVEQSQIIGNGAFSSYTGSGMPYQIADVVAIGDSTMQNVTTGSNGNTGATVSQVVAIGSGVNPAGNGTPAYCVAIGHLASMGENWTTSLGHRAGRQGTNANGYPSDSSVFLGANSGASGATPAYAFVVEVADENAINVNTMFYGRFDQGNLIVGKMLAANRDLETIGATNALKLTNGTRGAGNPTGGGFFYVNAGALHWVGSSGTDTTIAVA